VEACLAARVIAVVILICVKVRTGSSVKHCLFPFLKGAFFSEIYSKNLSLRR
jgi:hypothetical protein